MNPPLKYNPKTESLVLRACRADLTSRDGFSWKNKHVKAPDWSSAPKCGGGLHGWLNGQGDPDAWGHQDDDKWLILAVKTSTIVNLGGKVKFPSARKLYVGSKVETASLLASILPGVPVMFANLTGGDRSTLTGGNYSTLTGGNYSTLTGGNYSTLTGGYGSTLTGGGCSTLTGGHRSTLTGGHRSTLTGGDRSILTGSYGSTLTGGGCSTLTGGYGSTLTGGGGSTLTGGNGSALTGGDRSTLTGGDCSTLTGGNDSTLTGGDRSTLTGGDCSTLTGGYGSTLTGGGCSTLQIKWWDHVASRGRIATAYVGEDGIEANTAYKLDANYQFIKA